MGRSSQSKSSGGPLEQQHTKLFLSLLRARRRSGLTASEVARRMGTTRQQVYEMETRRGGDPTARTIERYAKAIGVKIVVVSKN